MDRGDGAKHAALACRGHAYTYTAFQSIIETMHWPHSPSYHRDKVHMRQTSEHVLTKQYWCQAVGHISVVRHTMRDRKTRVRIMMVLIGVPEFAAVHRKNASCMSPMGLYNLISSRAEHRNRGLVGRRFSRRRTQGAGAKFRYLHREVFRMRAAFLGPFLLENAAMAFFNFPQSPSRLAPCMPGTPSPRSWCQNYPRVRITALSIMACSVHCLAAATAASTLAATDLPAGFDAPTYAIYKPRGVLSITGADEASAKKVPRRTLTDLMVSAGLKPLPGHVGRLDLETGGLILVTGDGLLLEAALAVPFAVSLQADSSFKPLPKTYMLLLAGRHLADTAAIEGLRAPLTHRRGGKEYNSDGATVRVVRCFQSEELATEYALLDDDDVDVGGRREAIRAKRNQTVRSRKTGELVKPFVPSDGWLTEME
eukprot:991270-Rhodomonas_salina.1